MGTTVPNLDLKQKTFGADMDRNGLKLSCLRVQGGYCPAFRKILKLINQYEKNQERMS